MNEQETREKIAQILAKQLCPNKNAHFASWGSATNCYSRMNFAECEKMADATDALIAEHIGDISELLGKIEQLEAENAALRERLRKAMSCPFVVVDTKTGKEADVGEIAKEEWASNLMRHDIEGFAIMENRNLALLDECGNWAYCPSDRFNIVFKGNGETEK